MDPDVRKHLGGILTPDEAARRAASMANRPTTWAVTRQDDEVLLGLVTLSPRDSQTELSYMFLPAYWGKGFALECCQAMLTIAFGELELDRVIAITQSANVRSCRLLEALGMSPIRSFIEFGAEQTEYEFPRSRWSAGFTRHADQGFSPGERL